jgi:hypothetical protein
LKALSPQKVGLQIGNPSNKLGQKIATPQIVTFAEGLLIYEIFSGRRFAAFPYAELIYVPSTFGF